PRELRRRAPTPRRPRPSSRPRPPRLCVRGRAPAAARAPCRRRGGGTRSPGQRRRVAGREEPHAFAIRLTPEDERAEPQRPEEQQARALGIAEPVMLGEEPEVSP